MDEFFNPNPSSSTSNNSFFYYDSISIPINDPEHLRLQSQAIENMSNYPPWSLFSEKNPSFRESLESLVDEVNSLSIETGARNIDPRFGIYELDENPNFFMATQATFNNRFQPILGLPREDPRIFNGIILMLAKDQYGYRVLEDAIEEGYLEDIDFMFIETIRYFRELMIHRIGSSFVRKMLRVCNPLYITQIVSLVVSDLSRLLEICVDNYGGVAIKKLIDYVSMQEQRMMLVSALGYITLDLLKDAKGHQVVQHCLMSFNNEENKPILDVMADNCFEIAKDKIGCFVLQYSLSGVRGYSWNRMVNQIIHNVYVLSKDPHGNYVIQNVISLQIREVNSHMLSQLSKKFILLSMNKFGSNVVEKFFKVCDDDQKEVIVKEFMNVPIFLRLAEHPFGNFVAQAALMNLSGNIVQELVSLVMSQYHYLRNHHFGRNVLEKARLINSQ
ncbi:pumilio homolog 12-like [Impatiens glandulifera]|uniref:pumilio homolog 12-like n=1 Tax=Impatiens glandulifera TaxID=253017 RepID=UPI001FB04E3C|nr:pumilio homolog 12-like [Impatiens glandulifera]